MFENSFVLSSKTLFLNETTRSKMLEIPSKFFEKCFNVNYFVDNFYNFCWKKRGTIRIEIWKGRSIVDIHLDYLTF